MKLEILYAPVLAWGIHSKQQISRELLMIWNFGKANGLDRLTSEHLKYGIEKLYALLCIGFIAMWLHNHVPTEFSNTILVPIIKDKKGNITNLDNYRTLAISTVASKILTILFSRKLLIANCLYTSNNQFSYKTNSSTDIIIIIIIIDLLKRTIH